MVPPDDDTFQTNLRKRVGERSRVDTNPASLRYHRGVLVQHEPLAEWKDLRKHATEGFLVTALKNMFLFLVKALMGSPFFSEKQLAVLREYRNFGEDRSILYRWILSKFYDSIVHLLPLWMAPNLVTFIGLLCAVTSHGIVLYFCPELDDDASRVVYLLAFVGLFIYMVLDNLDGRQARRTKSSSPLGHLFDHGCDALNVTLSGLTFATVIRLGASFWTIFIVWVYGMLPFFFATLEEFFTGALILRQINGPNEGLIIMQVLYLFTALKGSNFWKQQVSFFNLRFPIPWNKFLILLAVPLCVPTVIGNYREIWRDAVRKRKCLKTRKIRSFQYAWPFISFSCCMFLWFAQSSVLQSHLFVFVWTCGLVFFALVTRLIVAHLTHSEYETVFFIEAPFMIGAINSVFSALLGRELVPDTFLLYSAFIMCSFLNVIRVFQIVNELTNALQISCFTLARSHHH
eukprot:jgi/Galph1/4956/GphlegSOOS_G3637.1